MKHEFQELLDRWQCEADSAWSQRKTIKAMAYEECADDLRSTLRIIEADEVVAALAKVEE